MVRIVCWNIAKRRAPWNELLQTNADVALLQEADPTAAPASLDSSPYQPEAAYGYDRWPMVVKLSDNVKIEWFKPVNAAQMSIESNEIAVSDSNTIAAARVTPLKDGEPFIVLSMYARWIKPVVKSSWSAGYADASAHRIISDLSAFIGYLNPASHRIVAAGDLNTIYEETVYSLQPRDATVFDRMEALGLEFVGPRWPDADKQADPAPKGLPKGTRNVPTYLSAHQLRLMRNEGTFTGHQLDYVFASKGFDRNVSVYAMNDPARWGPSDHCRVVIDVR